MSETSGGDHKRRAVLPDTPRRASPRLAAGRARPVPFARRLADGLAVAGRPTAFTAFAEDPGGIERLAWSWDFGDGWVDGARTAVGHAYGGGSQFFAMWVVGSDKP